MVYLNRALISDWVFNFSKEDSDHRYIPLGTAVALLGLMFPPSSTCEMNGQLKHIEAFSFFLTNKLEQGKLKVFMNLILINAKVLNRDQWSSFFEFSKTIANDFSDYDENGSWPVLFDEFVQVGMKDAEAE